MSVSIAKVYGALFPNTFKYDEDYDELSASNKLDIMSYPYNIRKLFYDTYSSLDANDMKRVCEFLPQKELDDIINNDPEVVYIDNIANQEVAITFDKSGELVPKLYKHLIYSDYKYLQFTKENDRSHYTIKNIILYDAGVLPGTDKPTYNVNYYLMKGLFYNNFKVSIKILSNVIEEEYVHMILDYVDPQIIFDRFNDDCSRQFDTIKDMYKLPVGKFEQWASKYLTHLIKHKVLRFEDITSVILKENVLGYYDSFGDIASPENLTHIDSYVSSYTKDQLTGNNIKSIFSIYAKMAKHNNTQMFKIICSKVCDKKAKDYRQKVISLMRLYFENCVLHKHPIEVDIINYSINDNEQIDLSIDVYSLLDSKVWTINNYIKCIQHNDDIKFIVKSNLVSDVITYLTDGKEDDMTPEYKEQIRNYLYKLLSQCIVNKVDISPYYGIVSKFELRDYKYEIVSNNNPPKGIKNFIGGMGFVSRVVETLGTNYIKTYHKEPPIEIYSSPRVAPMEETWRKYVNNDVPAEISKYSYYDYMIRNNGSRRPKNITALYTYLSNTTENKIIFINNDNTLDKPARLRHIIPINYDKVKDFLAEELITNDISLLTQVSNKDWEKQLQEETIESIQLHSVIVKISIEIEHH